MIPPRDCYPTPPAEAMVIGRFLEKQGVRGTFFDPFAGEGALVRSVFEGVTDARGLPAFRPWEAWEYREECRDALATIPNCMVRVGVDSLRTQWPDDVHVICNPPFSKAEDVFRLVMEHVKRTGCWGAILMRKQWIDDGERYRRYLPSHLLHVGRVKFMPGKSGDSATYSWYVFEPGCVGLGLQTKPAWPDKPKAPVGAIEFHRRMAAKVAKAIEAQGKRQTSLFGGA